MLTLIIIFSLIGGTLSLVGGVLLLNKKNWSHESMLTLVSFAAGVLLAVAFTDLLPEALKMTENPNNVLRWVLAAIVSFFLFERSFIWFHHHHQPHKNQPDPLISMVLIGDTLHNFLDGIVITASFLVSAPLGITTAIAVAAHEVPQEIADFSLYLSHQLPKPKIFLLNFLSSMATTVGAVIAFFFWNALAPFQPHLLAFTAGMFIYIASSDLIPELHDHQNPRCVIIHSTTFLLGIALTLVLGSLLASP